MSYSSDAMIDAMNENPMFVCTICGAISSDGTMAERHFDHTHLGKDEPEDPFWAGLSDDILSVETN